jgi:hypothetical protein
MPIAALAGGLVTYVAIGSLMTPAVVAEIKVLNGWKAGLVLSSFPLISWLAIILHEGGHLLGGKLAGMRPLLMFAGPIKLSFDRGVPPLSWNQALSTWGGLAIAIPVRGRANRGMLAMMVSGGPATSLFTASAGWIAAYLVADAARLPIALFAAVSTAIGFATLIPLRAGGFLSDGGQLLQIAKGSQSVEARLNLSIVIGESLSGVRPRDWSVSLVRESITGVSDPILRTSGLSMIAAAADDSNDLESAHAAYEAFAKTLHEGGLRSYPRAFRGDLVLPIAIFIAERFKDVAAAERWIEIGKRNVVEKYLPLYAEAICADARGDAQASHLYAKQAIALLPDTSRNGSVVTHRERLMRLANPVETDSVSTVPGDFPKHAI